MPEIVPSFIQKINRAEKHVKEFKAEFDRFADSHPYEVRTTIKGKRKTKTRRLMFTASPENTDMPIIAADVIYNLRSGLDHLAAALVPATDRDSVAFPIFWEGVWEPIVPGENEQRIKDRQRWQTYTRHMAAGAVAHIKAMQPDLENPLPPQLVNTFVMLNRLSNTDRHSKFPLSTACVRNLVLNLTLADGTTQQGIGANTFQTGHALEHGAPITDIPYSAVKVEATGTPLVVLSFRDPDTNVEVPAGFDMAIDAIWTAANNLIPYLRVNKAAARRAVSD